MFLISPILPPYLNSSSFIDTDKLSFKKIFEIFENINNFRFRYLMFGTLVLIGFIIPACIPNVEKSISFPLLLTGFVIFIIVLINYFGVYFFNERVMPNRYSYTYRIINTYMSEFEKQLVDAGFDNSGNLFVTEATTGDEAKNIYIFMNMCMSYYFGDRKWVDDANKKNKPDLITKIEKTVNKNKETSIKIFSNEKPLSLFTEIEKILLAKDT
jgi:hypothetical protein